MTTTANPGFAGATFRNLLLAVRAARAHGWYGVPKSPALFLFMAEHARLDAGRKEFFAHDPASLAVFDWAVRRRVAASFAERPDDPLPFAVGGDPFSAGDWAELVRRAEAMRDGYAAGDYLLDRIDTWLLESYTLPGLCEAEAGGTVLDCGAHSGNTALYFSGRVGPAGHVYAFEPAPAIHKRLERNLAGRDNVTPVAAAVALRSGSVHLEECGPASHLAPSGRKVAAVSLDEFVRERGVGRVDFIKMDIEGAEADALRGAAGIVRARAPAVALAAYHQPLDLVDLPTVIEAIRPGYRFYLRHFSPGQDETVLFCAPPGGKAAKAKPAAPAAVPAPPDAGELAELLGLAGVAGCGLWSKATNRETSAPPNRSARPPGAAAAGAPPPSIASPASPAEPAPEGGEPFLSVVIPAYNAAKTLGRCLDSLRDSLSGIAFEIVVVDDGSRDRTGAAAERARGGLPRLHLIRQKNQGQGPARNAGLAAARGRYVWFVDADDFVPGGAFAGLDAEAACGGCDVLLFPYRTRGRPDAELADIPELEARTFAARPGDAFTARTFPGVLAAGHQPWNKWFRRAFLDEAGIRFPNNLYEDLQFAVACLARAREIRFLDRALYAYCADLSTLSRLKGVRRLEAFGAFDDCERLLASLSATGAMLTAFRVAKANFLVWIHRSVEPALKPGVKEYMEAYFHSFDGAELLAVATHPLLREEVRGRLAGLGGVNAGLLARAGRARGWLGRVLRRR